MFHSNFEINWHIYINILNRWEPNRIMESFILGILEIMDNAISDGGYKNEESKLLEKNVDEFYKRVKEYTYSYAKEGFPTTNNI